MNVEQAKVHHVIMNVTIDNYVMITFTSVAM